MLTTQTLTTWSFARGIHEAPHLPSTLFLPNPAPCWHTGVENTFFSTEMSLAILICRFLLWTNAPLWTHKFHVVLPGLYFNFWNPFLKIFFSLLPWFSLQLQGDIVSYCGALWKQGLWEVSRVDTSRLFFALFSLARPEQHRVSQTGLTFKREVVWSNPNCLWWDWGDTWGR